MRGAPPTFEEESALFDAGCGLVAGVDEVGRGAWAGPVSVGVAVIDRSALARFPPGVRDSKQLTPAARASLFGPLERACWDFAIGHASNLECDELGMTGAQRLATARALDALQERPDALLVDGSLDFSGAAGARALVGADRLCLVVAAASVLAKQTRDALMRDHAVVFPGYGFEAHKGYVSATHREAVARLGLSALHRRSWDVAPGGWRSAPGCGARL